MAESVGTVLFKEMVLCHVCFLTLSTNSNGLRSRSMGATSADLKDGENLYIYKQHMNLSMKVLAAVKSPQNS
jgi:hypothetical protein